jgi:membrane protein
MLEKPPSRRRSFITLLWAAYGEYERDYARFFGAAMVYYTLVSLVPVLLLLLAGLGLMLRFSDLAASAEQQILNMVESSFGLALGETLEQLLEHLKQESIIATIVSLAGLIVTGSALFRHLRASFRAIWKHTPPLVSGSMRAMMRMTFVDHIVSFALVLAAGGVLLGTLAAFAVIQWLTGLLDDGHVAGQTAAWLLALPVPLVIASLTFAILFKVLPPVRIEWRDVWLAGLVCGLAFTFASEFVALYAIFFGETPSTSGAIGGLLVVMLWVNIVSKVLFYGAELSKIVWSRRNGAVPA